jgi:hypothetical protein
VYKALLKSHPSNAKAFVRLPPGESVDPAPYLGKLLQQLLGDERCAGLDVGAQRHHLQQLANTQPLTLVVDNVWNSKSVELLVPDNLQPGSKVVITSRSTPFDQRSSLVSGSCHTEKVAASNLHV